MLLERAIDAFLTEKTGDGCSQSTVNSYGNALYRFAKVMTDVVDTEDFDAFNLKAYIARMQQDAALSPISVNRNVRTLRVFGGWLWKEDLIRTNPFDENLKNPVKVPRFDKPDLDILPVEDFKKLLASCDRGTDKGRRDEAIMMFLYDTGVRVGELVRLRMDDLDMKARQARVLGKGRKFRTVFWSAQTAVALSRYHSRRRAGHEYAFTGQANRPLTGFGVAQMLYRRAERTGVTSRVNPHTFRHTFATNYLRLGGDPHSLQRILGHSDVSTTIRNYAHLVDDDLKTKHEQFSPLTAALGRRG